MKSRPLFFSCLAVSLAAGGGFYGGHQWRGRVGAGAAPASVSGTGLGKEALKMPFSSPPAGVKAWADRLRKCQASDLPGVFAEISVLPEGTRRREVAERLLCARWAELDPASGMIFFSGSAIGYPDLELSARVGMEWALRDPAAAHASIQSGEDGPSRLSRVGLLLLREDRSRFLEWFRLARVPLPYPSSEAWARLAETHWEELAAMAAGLEAASSPSSEPADLRAFYQVLAISKARRDPDRALIWAKELPETVRGAALAAAWGELARHSPEKIIGWFPLAAAGVDETLVRERLLETALNTMARRDPLQAVSWLGANAALLENAVPAAAVSLAALLAEAIREGRLEPPAVLAEIRKLPPDSEWGDQLLASLWRKLPPARFAGAAEWLRQADTGEPRCSTFGPLLLAWAAKDQAAAGEFLSRLHDPEITRTTWRRALREARDADSAISSSTKGERFMTMLRQIPEADRADALGYTLDGGVRGNPEYSNRTLEGSGLALAVGDLPPSDTVNLTVKLVAGHWGKSAPEAALEWASRRGDAAQRKMAIGAAVASWAGEDAWQASEWVDAQPEGERRDTASRYLAEVLSGEEPESGWSWAGSIADPALRLEARAAVLREWGQVSAADAGVALEAVAGTLPPAERQRLTDVLRLADVLRKSPSSPPGDDSAPAGDMPPDDAGH